MALSPIDLGELLDSWAAADQANIIETQAAVTVSNLAADFARRLFEAATPDWSVEIADGAMQPSDAGHLDDHMGPYIVTINKPVAVAGIRILTRLGFLQALESIEVSGVWQIACARHSFSTGFASFNPWGCGDVFASATETKSPLDLVREGSERRLVPADIRKWLLRSKLTYALWEDLAFKAFVTVAAAPLVRSLASEVVGRRDVVFLGPPRLNLPINERDLVADLQQEGFICLQSSVAWVYEDRTAAEQRHGIFAAEFARSITRQETLGGAFRIAGKNILEGARLAYQLSQSELSREAIKAQGDLRKTIAEDMSKIADGTRSLTTAIAVAIATGIGLVAARSTSTGEPWVLSSIAAIVALYLIAVTFSGWQYLRLQKRLREQWRQRLYRFIPSDDYAAMVTNPAKQAETPYHFIGVTGLLIAGALIFVAYLAWAAPTNPSATSSINETITQPQSGKLRRSSH